MAVNPAIVDQHFEQAAANIFFLETINNNTKRAFDWEVTVCFYIAVHLVNAHLAHYGIIQTSHKRVGEVLDPKGIFSCKLDTICFGSYLALTELSRRSRYKRLPGLNDSGNLLNTRENHFKKAIAELEILIAHFNMVYGKALSLAGVVNR